MAQQPDALRKRISEFALAVLKLVRRLPRDVATDSVVRRVARSAAGMASNYGAACSARSAAELVEKLGVALEEADDTRHWLWMAEQLQLARGKAFDDLIAESREIHAILSENLSTARQTRRAAEDPRRKTPKSSNY
jgi:four helix bundle protein